MDEFTLSAFALYRDGRSGDAFAEVWGPILSDCFAEMAAEVSDWLTRTLARDDGNEAPRAIDLTLEWSGTPASAPAPHQPKAPPDPVQRSRRGPRRALCRAQGRRLSTATAGALPLRFEIGELLESGA